MERKVAAAHVVTLLRQNDDRAAFRGFIGERRELRGIGKVIFFNPACWVELRGGAIAERDRAGFVEQEYVHVA